MAVAAVVAAIVSRRLCPRRVTVVATRRIPLAMLERARSQMVVVMATLTMRAATLTHAGAADIAALEGQGVMTRLQRGRKAKK